MQCDLLILGLGWTGQYVYNDCIKNDIQVKATTTTGRDNTIKFAFTTETTIEEIEQLPRAQSIIITFKITETSSIEKLVSGLSLGQDEMPKMILLGSTRPWNPIDGNWCDINHPTPDERFIVEQQFLTMGGCVLNLAGLFGGLRQPKNWISRVASSKEQLGLKKSLHLIHGRDISRLVLAVFKKFVNQRFLVTDMRIYDWLEIVLLFGNNEQKGWGLEIIKEDGIRSVPREHQLLERCIDGTQIWNHFDLLPLESLYSD